METPTTIIDHIRARLANCTQAELARQMGVSDAYVSGVLCGTIPPGPKIVAGLGLVKIVMYVPNPEGSQAMPPSKSPKQARTMRAAAHNPQFAKKVGIPQNVARDFEAADEAKAKPKKRR